MKNLTSLVVLIRKLNENELKILLKYLMYYSGDVARNRSVLLVNRITTSKKINSNEIQMEIYGYQNQVAFNKLINRVKSKVLEVFLFDSNLEKNIYAIRTKTSFQLKKQILYCEILNVRGLRQEADQLTKKILSKAKKYELFDIISSCYELREGFLRVRGNKRQLNKIILEKNTSDEKNKSYSYCQNIYNFIINKINNTDNPLLYKDDLVSAIDKLELEYIKYNSFLVGYYLYFIKTEFFQIEENYIEADKCLKKLLKIVNHKSIFSLNRMGATLLNISNNFIYLKNYNDSIKTGNEAKRYFPNNILNQSMVDEILFYSYYYLNNYNESRKIISRLVEFSNIGNIGNIGRSINKWKYLDAALDFCMKRFDKCLLKLNDIFELEKDREGWNIGRRLLSIMTNIELQKYEIVDLEIIRLEKYLKRISVSSSKTLRYKTIVKILQKLMNSNYQFNEVAKSRSIHLNKLSALSGELSRNIRGPELIDFVLWFKSKTEYQMIELES